MKHRLVINPEADQEFVELVRDLDSHNPESPDTLQEGLRWRYQDAVVRNGVEEIDGTKRWYVYRDGHWQTN